MKASGFMVAILSATWAVAYMAGNTYERTAASKLRFECCSNSKVPRSHSHQARSLIQYSSLLADRRERLTRWSSPIQVYIPVPLTQALAHNSYRNVAIASMANSCCSSYCRPGSIQAVVHHHSIELASKLRRCGPSKLYSTQMHRSACASSQPASDDHGEAAVSFRLQDMSH